MLGPIGRRRDAGWRAVGGSPLRVPFGLVDRPLAAAPGPAGARPDRRVRAPRGGRRAAVGQVDRAGHRRARAGADQHARPSWACTCSTSAAGRWPRWPGCRTSARSPTASSPTWCAGIRRRVRAPRWPGGSGCSARPGIASVAEFRARRAAGAFPDEPATDLLLVVDGYLTLRGEFDDLEARLLPLAAQGPVLRAAPRGVGQPVERAAPGAQGPARRPRRAAARRSAGVRGGPAPGRRGAAPARARAGARRVRPRCWPRRAPARRAHDRRRWWRRSPRPGPGRRSPPVRLLPERIDARPAAGRRPARRRDPDRRGRAARAGRARLRRRAAPALLRRRGERQDRPAAAAGARDLRAGTPRTQARIVVVDHRRTLLGAVPGHAPDRARQHRRRPRPRLPGRSPTRCAAGCPGPACRARALRERSWWTGPEVYLLVDDYDLVAPAGGGGAPAAAAGGVPAAGQGRRAARDRRPALRRGGPGAVRPAARAAARARRPGAGDERQPGRGRRWSRRSSPRALPPGRGILVDRRRGARRVQLAWLPPGPRRAEP